MADTRIIGNFELIERIGQGGMGAVFKARQVSMDRIVALKVLPPRLAKQGTFIERFMREAHAVARLNHPNIVRGIDVGEDGGVYYLAMEFVDGGSAKQLIRPGGLPEDQVLKIGKAVAEALGHAHAQGILHRDIKPDNILIDKDGTPKLCDLGLARLDTHSDEDHSLTQAGTAMGTPFYISPEQARGEPDLDAKTDLYSLGATLLHLLTGKPVFDGPTSAVVMMKHLTAKCPNPADEGIQVSRGFMMILGKLLVKDRADRYDSAQTLAEDLDRVMHGNLPQHAGLPSAKWPFSGSLPAAPMRKTGGVPAPGTPPERSRATRVRSSANATRLIAIGGAVAMVVILAVLIINGTHAKPADAGTAPSSQPASLPSTEPAPVAVSVEQLNQQLEFAQDLAKRTPDDYQGIIAEFEKLRVAAAGTEFEGKAKDAIAETSRRRDAAANAAAQRCADQAAVLEAQGRYDSAIAVWEQATAKNPLIPVLRAAKATADLHSHAEEKLEKVLDEGQRCLVESRWDDGRKALAAATGIEYSAWQPRLEDLRGKLAAGEQAAAEASRNAAQTRAHDLFSKHLDRFMDATLKDDLKGALKVASDAHADPALKEIAATVQDLTDLCTVLQKIEAARFAALSALKDGRDHAFEKANGEKLTGIVTRVTPHEISLRMVVDGGENGSADMQVGIGDLSPRERGRLAGSFKPQTPADYLALGINAFAAADLATVKSSAAADFATAKTDLEAAKDHPLAAAYQARLDVKLLGAVEAAAKTAWEALERQAGGGKFSAAQAPELDKRLKTFLADHGQTKFAASISEQIAALQRQIDALMGLVLDLGDGVHLDAVLIHPGTFLMGSPPDEFERVMSDKQLNDSKHNQDRLDRMKRDQMQHKVTITHGFFIGKYTVTQEQFQEVMGDNPSVSQKPQLPVDKVSWNRTQEFCQALSQKTGRTVRLPTEAEWEYACRAGSTTAFCYGDDASKLGDYAWYSENTVELPNAVELKKDHLPLRDAQPVGTRKPNAWGLYDMHGNVAEWCQDWEEPFTADDQVDPTGPANGTSRVIRGGSRYVEPIECRSAQRMSYPPDRVNGHLGDFGFRIVVELPEAAGPKRNP